MSRLTHLIEVALGVDTGRALGRHRERVRAG